MNDRICNIAENTYYALNSSNFHSLDMDLQEARIKIDSANSDFKTAVSDIRNLGLDDLLSKDKQQELIKRQQKAVECYAKLKRVLLEAYHDLFHAIKGL